jgi:ABC-type dipeptide/oligopeptide/nickel transport system ATPase component
VVVDLTVVRTVTDRIPVMYLGKLVEETDTARFFAGSLHLYSQALLSSVPRDHPRQLTSRVDFRDAFYIATTGGGLALDLPIGNFSPGCHFDAIAVNAAAPQGSIRLWEDLDVGEKILQKIVYTTTKPNIASVWVGGRQIR